MRLTIRFGLEKDHIVFDTHNFLLSYIKFAFSKTYYDEFEQLYLKTPKRKLFTFSSFVKDMKYENGYIVSPHKEIKMYVSSNDSNLLLMLYNALLINKSRKMDVRPNNKIWIKTINLRYLDKIVNNEITIKFLSPLLLRKHYRDTNKDVYITCEDKTFSSELNLNIKRLCDEFGYPYSFIEIFPQTARKTAGPESATESS